MRDRLHRFGAVLAVALLVSCDSPPADPVTPSVTPAGASNIETIVWPIPDNSKLMSDLCSYAGVNGCRVAFAIETSE